MDFQKSATASYATPCHFGVPLLLFLKKNIKENVIYFNEKSNFFSSSQQMFKNIILAHFGKKKTILYIMMT